MGSHAAVESANFGACGRRGSLRAGRREVPHESGSVGSEAAEVHHDDADSLRRAVGRLIRVAPRGGVSRLLGRAR